MYWLANFLPYWIFYLVLPAGVLGWFYLRTSPYFPFIRVARYAALVVVALGIYLIGYVHSHQAWKQRAQALEQQAKVVEQEAREASVVIQEKLVTKTQVIRERGQDVVKYIDREVVKYDQQCNIPQEVVDAHNRLAQGTKK